MNRTIAYRAWKIGCGANAIPLDIGEPDSLTDALNEAQLGNGLMHKDTLLIHRADTGTIAGELTTYAIVQKAATYRKNERTGLSERFHPLAPKKLFSVPVRDFQPDEPFDAFRDCAVGVDRNLITHGETA